MMIPFSIVLLSWIFKYRANRWVNIISGAFMTVFLTVTLFVAVPTMYYAFFSAIEIACTLFIVGYAWKWRNPEVSPIKVAIAQSETV